MVLLLTAPAKARACHLLLLRTLRTLPPLLLALESTRELLLTPCQLLVGALQLPHQTRGGADGVPPRRRRRRRVGGRARLRWRGGWRRKAGGEKGSSLATAVVCGSSTSRRWDAEVVEVIGGRHRRPTVHATDVARIIRPPIRYRRCGRRSRITGRRRGGWVICWGALPRHGLGRGGLGPVRRARRRRRRGGGGGPRGFNRRNIFDVAGQQRLASARGQPARDRCRRRYTCKAQSRGLANSPTHTHAPSQLPRTCDM
jgi:hypothetical protein